MRCSLTLSVHHHQKQVVSQLPFSRFSHLLSFYCMSCFVYCVPVCLRRQTFEHPFTEDPEREDNFVEADTRPPLVIYLCDLYSFVLISWSDYWEGEQTVDTSIQYRILSLVLSHIEIGIQVTIDVAITPARRQAVYNLDSWDSRGEDYTIPDSGVVTHPTDDRLDSSLGIYYIRSRQTVRTGRFVYFLFRRRRRLRQSLRLCVRVRHSLPSRFRNLSVLRLDTSLNRSISNVIRGTVGRVYHAPPNRLRLAHRAAFVTSRLSSRVRLLDRETDQELQDSDIGYLRYITVLQYSSVLQYCTLSFLLYILCLEFVRTT